MSRAQASSGRRGWRGKPALALVAVLVALAMTGGSSAAARPGAAGIRNAAASASPAASGAAPRIERADIHVDDLPGAGDEFEMDLAITETQNDCGTPPRGQLCLRYTISTDDVATEDGYGLIPISAVRMTPSTITLNIDTTSIPHMNLVAGKGGTISVTWYLPLGLPHPVNQAAALAVATVQGSIVGYAVPATNVTAAVLMSTAP